jgi:hypothetical protein
VFRSSKPPVLAALLLSSLALAACGESAQEKATAQVCKARTEISKQITKLEGLTISSNTVTEAKTSFEAIGKELTEIKNAQSNLEPARKEQVQSATKSFETQLGTITAGVVASLGSGNIEAQLKNAGPQLKSALSQLGADFKQALGPISCP